MIKNVRLVLTVGISTQNGTDHPSPHCAGLCKGGSRRNPAIAPPSSLTIEFDPPFKEEIAVENWRIY